MQHGANAVIVGRKLDRLTETAAELSKLTGQTCIPAQADVRQPSQVRHAASPLLSSPLRALPFARMRNNRPLIVADGCGNRYRKQ
jgi:NAD(P)-dependent dehydrogenase (short-subunit alcohol dehydrogenase family)